MTEITGGRQGAATILIPLIYNKIHRFPVKNTEISMISTKQNLSATQGIELTRKLTDLVDVHTLVPVTKICQFPMKSHSFGLESVNQYK